MGTGVQTTEEIEKLMDMTDPELVSLLLIQVILFFRRRATLYFEKYLPRIKHVHLKDIRQEVVDAVKENELSFLQAVKNGAFTVPGDGVIDLMKCLLSLQTLIIKGGLW